jgi:WD40 repeat protein
VFGLEFGGKNLLDLQWQGTLCDYVTAIAWSPTSETLAASSAAGEVVLWRSDTLTKLQTGTGESVDTIAFSPDGQFLAAGGQDGQVRIWHLQGDEEQGSKQALHPLTSSRPHPLTPGLHPVLLSPPFEKGGANVWVDQLAWSPIGNQLAFSIGRFVQIWDADTGEVRATLNFEASSVLGIDWRPDGQYLAVCGHRGVKVWNAQNWNDEPHSLNIRAASIAIAWSTDGKYLASGNMDCTLAVWEWNNPDPWIMRGFPGKIRNLAWSEPLTPVGAPVLAASCAQSITVWEKQQDESAGWEARVLELHDGIVQAIAFQPGTFLLASAANDSYICLWQEATQLAQILEGATSGFSCVAWHSQRQGRTQGLPLLAVGGQNGELLIWSKLTEVVSF